MLRFIKLDLSGELLAKGEGGIILGHKIGQAGVIGQKSHPETCARP